MAQSNFSGQVPEFSLPISLSPGPNIMNVSRETFSTFLTDIPGLIRSTWNIWMTVPSFVQALLVKFRMKKRVQAEGKVRQFCRISADVSGIILSGYRDNVPRGTAGKRLKKGCWCSPWWIKSLHQKKELGDMMEQKFRIRRRCWRRSSSPQWNLCEAQHCHP